MTEPVSTEAVERLADELDPGPINPRLSPAYESLPIFTLAIAANALRSLVAERDALRGVVDWVRQYRQEWDVPDGGQDLVLRASIRQAMFDALAALAEGGSGD